MMHALKRLVVAAGIGLGGTGLFASAALADGDMYILFTGLGLQGMSPGHGRDHARDLDRDLGPGMGPGYGPGPMDGPRGGRHGGLGLGQGGWMSVKSYKWGDERGHALTGSNARQILPRGVGPGSLTVRLEEDGPGVMLDQYCGADVPVSSVFIQVAGPRSGSPATAYALRHVTLKCKGSATREITMIYEAADLPSPAGLNR